MDGDANKWLTTAFLFHEVETSRFLYINFTLTRD
jgi:hypothetical protein